MQSWHLKDQRMQMEVKRRGWRFLGHALRVPREYHCATTLTWTPMGTLERKVGCPKTTWRPLAWRKRERWRAESLGRKRELWLRTGESGRGVVRPSVQQGTKTIGEVRWRNVYEDECKTRSSPRNSLSWLRCATG